MGSEFVICEDFIRDKPFWGNWLPSDASWICEIGLPKPKSQAYSEARAYIILEAIILACIEPGRWISYPRRKGWYAEGQRYRSPACTFATVPSAVDELTQLGLLEHDPASPGSRGWQSRFRATPALCAAVLLPSVIYAPRESIRLRNQSRQLIDYADTDATARMRRKICEINEMLRHAAISLPGLQGAPGTIRLARNQLHRVFNRGSFNLGGRFYGPFWQGLPKTERAMLRIAGEPVDEGDYAQLHPRLLYAEAGVTLEDDAYTIQGFADKRKLMKRAFNILINADTERAALGAISQEIDAPHAHAIAREILEAIKAAHPRISGYFGSGAGLRLQCCDSNIAEQVMLGLGRRGVIGLSVHDSFIVQARHAGIRDEIMEAELNKVLAASGTGRKLYLPKGYIKKGLHKEEVVVAAAAVPEAWAGCTAGRRDAAGPMGAARRLASAAVVAAPVPADVTARTSGGPTSRPSPPALAVAPAPDDVPDHEKPGFTSGGLAPFTIPAASIAGWPSGRPPELIAMALRHELRARGLTQDRLARRIGLSRPHVTNLLVGRAGASSQVAARLKEFLLAA